MCLDNIKMDLRAQRKKLDVTTIQNHNKLKKEASLRRPLRTPNNIPTFRFKRKGTRTQTILIQDHKY
jgi:hypothetical protein